MEKRTVPSTPFPDAVDTWNNRFRNNAYIFGTDPNNYLQQHTRVWQPGDHVLCVADGEGRNSVWLAQQGLAVDAFDISNVGVAKAKKLAAGAGVMVRYDISDCDSWPWPEGVYDGIAAIFVQFADPEMRKRLFANIVRALKPGGYLVLQGYTPKQLEYKTGGPPLVSHLYTAPMLREAFSGLEIVELREYEEVLNEGTQHAGMSALIGMVVRK